MRSIKNSVKFFEVIEEGTKFSNGCLIFFYIKSHRGESLHYGISVKKKLGTAVLRNKIKRQIRELFKKNSEYLNGLRVVVIVTGQAGNVSFKELSDSFCVFIKKKLIIRSM